MAHPGASTFPGENTFPGDPYAPPVEGPVPGGRSAPLGLPPREALLVMLSPANRVGTSIVRECPPDLEFSNVAPGGHDAMTCTVDWPSGLPVSEALGITAIARVVDRRNGSVIWYGHVVDPGDKRSRTASSQKIACKGYYTILETSAASVAYIDREYGNWLNINDYPAGGGRIVDDVSVGSHPGDWVPGGTSVIEMAFTAGSSLDASTPSHMTMQYLPAWYSSSGQDIVMVLGTHDEVGAGGGFRVQVRVRSATGGTTQTVINDPYTSTAIDFLAFQESGDWTMLNARVAELRFEYDSDVDGVASRDWWLRWGNLTVVFQRLNRDGSLADSRTTYLRAWHIVNDVIGRLLKDQLDISAAIAQPTKLIEQAAWFEGVTARGIFDFIEDAAPENYWAVWEPDVSSKPRFEYLPWAVRPRYIIPPNAGVLELAGGGEELYNRALVTYQTSNGVPASLVVTAPIRELTATNTVRTMVVDLTGEGTLSATTATSKGLDALVTADLMRTSGTARIFGPVYDVKAGRMIEPWEIRAGWPVVMATGELRSDNGYPYSRTGERNGRSTFRLTEVRYSAGSGSAELTLDGGGRNWFNRVKTPVPRDRAKRLKDAITHNQTRATTIRNAIRHS